MKGPVSAWALLSASELALASNTTRSNCYETAPQSKHYKQVWKAQGKSFFDDLNFATGPPQTSGAAYYLDQKSAFEHGVVETTAHRAKMRVGKAFNTASGPRRYSASVSTKKRYKHFLGVLKYKHVPFGLGVWPAFWMNGPGKWPEGGELDVLEYASHEGQKVSLHTGAKNHCKLSAHEVTKCTEMPDTNGMDYNCYTNYGKKQLGCAPTTFAGQRPPEWWSENPGALAIEWTERFLKVFWFPDSKIPDDLDTDYPKPETWDEKWIISYFPFAASNEAHPGSCPNPADVLDAQKLILNIELCGDWAGQKWEPWDQDPFKDEWRAKRDRGECKVRGYHTADDCCSQYLAQSKMNGYLSEHAVFDISYLKLFQMRNGPAPPPPADMRRRRRAAPAPVIGKCVKVWHEDIDCDGKDLFNTKIDTANDCCELCGNTSGCLAFTHNVFDGHLSPTCYLKASCHTSDRKGKRGCTSGIVHKAPTPPPPPTPPGKCAMGNYLDNTDCSGADLKNMPKDSPDDCCAECSETAGCGAFTYNVADGHGRPYCYLKKTCKKSKRTRVGGATSMEHVTPSTTSRRRSSPSPSTGCCSWASSNVCGQTTDYCAAKADNCVVCGGHWVSSAHAVADADMEAIDEMIV